MLVVGLAMNSLYGAWAGSQRETLRRLGLTVFRP